MSRPAPDCAASTKPRPARAVSITLAVLTLSGSARGATFGDWSVGGDVTAVSDYVSRGLTQTWGKPALQGQIEAEHDVGFYSGLFVSNVSRNEYPGGSVETEVWLGYEYEIDRDVALTAEATYFGYPGANADQGTCAAGQGCPSQTFNTTEGRLSARWRWLSARFAYAFTNYFGATPATGYQAGTRGTWYLETNAAYAIPAAESWELGAHLGYTRYSALYASPNPQGTQDPSYWDWRVSITKTFSDTWGAWRLGAQYTQASNASFYNNTRSLVNSGTFDLGRPTLIVSIGRTF